MPVHQPYNASVPTLYCQSLCPGALAVRTPPPPRWLSWLSTNTTACRPSAIPQPLIWIRRSHGYTWNYFYIFYTVASAIPQPLTWRSHSYTWNYFYIFYTIGHSTALDMEITIMMHEIISTYSIPSRRPFPSPWLGDHNHDAWNYFYIFYTVASAIPQPLTWRSQS